MITKPVSIGSTGATTATTTQTATRQAVTATSTASGDWGAGPALAEPVGRGLQHELEAPTQWHGERSVRMSDFTVRSLFQRAMQRDCNFDDFGFCLFLHPDMASFLPYDSETSLR